MIKTILSVMIIALFSYTGFNISWQMNRMNEDLKLILFGLDILSDEICYKLSPLNIALKSAGHSTGRKKNPVSEFFLNLSLSLEQKGIPFHEIWEEELNNLIKRVHLTNGADRVLYNLGLCLGKSGWESQKAAIDNAKRELSAILSEGTENYKRYHSLISNSGIILGVLIVLVIV